MGFFISVLNQCDTRQWKLAENVSCTKLFVRNDIYDLFMENLPTLEKMIYYRWEDSCIKATLLLHARTEDEIEKSIGDMNCVHLFLKKMIWWSFISIMERKRQNAKALL